MGLVIMPYAGLPLFVRIWELMGPGLTKTSKLARDREGGLDVHSLVSVDG
jgi:hypothetical protein